MSLNGRAETGPKYDHQEAVLTGVQVAMRGAPAGSLPLLRNYSYGDRWDSSRGVGGGKSIKNDTGLLQHRLSDQGIRQFDRNLQGRFQMR